MREMKDSGIEWIGEIPKHWTVKNLKYIFDITSGSTPASGVSQYWDGDIKWITPADFKTNDVYVFGGRRNITGLALMSCSTQVIPDSSIIFSKRAPIGSVVITGEKMCINQGCLALVSKHQKTSVKFYYYALSILDKIFDMLGSGTTFKEISAFRFSNTTLQCPHFEEQQQIADFLDTQCSEIDATAEDIQKEISLLEEYKKSVITEAVTKGLNPDAEMKDSKIFYLGQINKTWNLTKVGYCCKKLYRPFEPSDEALVCSNKGKVVPRGDTLIGLMTSDDNAMQGICKGDIAIHGMDTWHGAIACSEYDGKITRVVHVCKADGDNRFVVYWLQHLAFVGVYKMISNGVRGNTSDFRSWDKVADIYVPNPIKEEQQQIADYLDIKCSEIDTIIADKKRQLDILADYKKSLIYEYVTGKKEVPVNE